MQNLKNSYSIRLGNLKPELEKLAVEKDTTLPKLIRAVLRMYLKKRKK